MRRQELHPRTAVINKAQKNKSKLARNEALLWLATTFPHAFDNTLSIHPLKVGIIDDILIHAEKAMELGISRSKLREAIVLFTRRIDYLTCLKAREMRVDLDGHPVAAVTEDEAEKAANKIKKRVEKCVRNARKITNVTTQSHYGVRPSVSKPSSATASYTNNDFNHHDHGDRSPMFGTQNASLNPIKAIDVVIKHKTVRQFDPDAVARLKEKLGLSRKACELKEENQSE